MIFSPKYWFSTSAICLAVKQLYKAGNEPLGSSKGLSVAGNTTCVAAPLTCVASHGPSQSNHASSVASNGISVASHAGSVTNPLSSADSHGSSVASHGTFRAAYPRCVARALTSVSYPNHIFSLKPNQNAIIY